MVEKWLVFGGLGFIGLAVAKEAHKQGIQVLTFDTKYPSHVIEHVNFDDCAQNAHYCGWDELAVAVKNVDVVLSFIAIPRIAYCQTHRQEAFETNVLKNVEIMNQCLKHDKPFVFASSMEVRSNLSVDVPSHFARKRYYKETKEKCEELIKGLLNKWLILRYSHVFGENDTHSNRVITRFLRGVFEVYNEPRKTFDYTYLPDVAKSTVFIVRESDWNHTYDMRSGKTYSLNYVITEIFKQKKYKVIHKPELLPFESVNVRQHFEDKVYRYERNSTHPGAIVIRGLEDVIKDGKLVEDND